MKQDILPPIEHSKEKLRDITNWLSKRSDEKKLKKITIDIKEIDLNNFSIQSYRFPDFINGVIV